MRDQPWPGGSVAWAFHAPKGCWLHLRWVAFGRQPVDVPLSLPDLPLSLKSINILSNEDLKRKQIWQLEFLTVGDTLSSG